MPAGVRWEFAHEPDFRCAHIACKESSVLNSSHECFPNSIRSDTYSDINTHTHTQWEKDGGETVSAETMFMHCLDPCSGRLTIVPIVQWHGALKGAPDLPTFFLHAVVGSGLSKHKRCKAHNAAMQCGFILINEKLGWHSQHSDRSTLPCCIVAFLLNPDLVN